MDRCNGSVKHYFGVPAGGLGIGGAVSIELSGGDFETAGGDCCFLDDDPISVSGTINNSVTLELTAQSGANITSGAMFATAQTNAWIDPGDMSLNLTAAQAKANITNTRITNDTGSAYTISSGELGLTYDAIYQRDQQNAQSGSHQFLLKLMAIVTDGAGDNRSVSTAQVNHIGRDTNDRAETGKVSDFFTPSFVH